MAGKTAKQVRRARTAEHHHGDLRRALVDATLDLIAAGGTHLVTLRSVARAVGVSHMAPYNHFADKAALVATAGAEGFRRLKRAMERRMETFAPGDPERLQAVGVAYVVFAVKNPELFRLMFGPELADTTSHQELGHAADDVYQTLLGALGLSGLNASATGPEMALTPWALVHGLAMLAIAGQLPLRSTNQMEALARDATYLLFVGMKNWRDAPRQPR